MEISRRDVGLGFIGSSLIAANPAQRQTVAVIGGGVFGTWTAYYLRSRGHDVTLVDAWGPGNSRSSSGGESRIIRAAYGPDELYSRMAMRSLPQWEALFAKRGRPLLNKTGVLWLAKPDNKHAQQSREVLRKIGCPFSDLSSRDLAERYPQIRISPGTVAIFEPESGALMARQAVEAVADEFVRIGGRIHNGAVPAQKLSGRPDSIRTSAGETIRADAFVFACGPWMGKVFPDLLGNRIFATRQEVILFGTPAGDTSFAPPRMPVWIDFNDDRGMYGFPDLERRGFKVAFDKHGPPFDPDTGDRIVTSQMIAEARTYLADRFPALANAPITESRVCQYENTSNGDFLIDRHPSAENVWLVGGGSGHGFKHGPAVGEYVAARVEGASSPAVELRFSLSSKQTSQHRAVY